MVNTTEAGLNRKSVSDLMQEIESLGDGTGKTTLNLKVWETALKNRIGAGETTGDPVVDFAILYGKSDPEIKKRLQSLRSTIKNYPGQLILVVRGRSVTAAFHGWGRRRKIVVAELRLGVISGKSLMINVKSGMCYAPTNNYAQCTGRSQGIFELVNSQLAVENHTVTPAINSNWEVVVGDKKVENWFRSSSKVISQQAWCRLKRMLGR